MTEQGTCRAREPLQDSWEETEAVEAEARAVSLLAEFILPCFFFPFFFLLVGLVSLTQSTGKAAKGNFLLLMRAS